jgi:hypothetical protein
MPAINQGARFSKEITVIFRKVMLVVCLCTAVSAMTAMAQDGSPFSSQTVAYVYVTTLPANSSTTQIAAYSAAANGALTPVDGSPFEDNEGALAVRGRFLYGLNLSKSDIDSFEISPAGVLTYAASTNWAQNNPNGCGGASWLFTDRTNTDLYDEEFDGDCANNGYQSYQAKLGTGDLSYLGFANGGAGSFSGVYLPATFLGNDQYAYEATNNGCFYYGISGFARGANGLLSPANVSWTLPTAPSGYRIYIPTFAAADPFNHVAITVWAANPPGCSTANQQIGSFTADSKGNLTTTNTSANMPTTQVAVVQDLKVSPSGLLLAVAGQGGLQVFHFNGANAPTAYTPLLTTDTISQTFWDNDNHLYAISQTSGQLLVFTVTPTSYSQAPGSPYAVAQPGGIAVQSRTLAIPGITIPPGLVIP